LAPISAIKLALGDMQVNSGVVAEVAQTQSLDDGQRPGQHLAKSGGGGLGW
jgi:hypothetical protein